MASTPKTVEIPRLEIGKHIPWYKSASGIVAVAAWLSVIGILVYLAVSELPIGSTSGVQLATLIAIGIVSSIFRSGN